MRRVRAACVGIAAAALLALPAAAQVVSGTIFEDRDGDGLRDASEPGLSGIAVRLFGTREVGGAIDATTGSASSGAYAFSPGNGCYLVAPTDPAGFRLGQAPTVGIVPSPGYVAPVGRSRRSKLDQGIAHLDAGALRYSALGDSIARNFNVFCSGTTFWYSRELRNRLLCVAPGAVPAVDEAAVLGEHTDDLLVDESNNLNNVFRMIDVQPQLISISMIGNDMLDVDPGDGASQAQIDAAITEVLDARRNLQEALSAMVSQIPGADIVLNTLYDNEASACAPTQFHRAWVPIVNGILRDLAWGQTRRVTLNEVRAEFAAVDQAGTCTGFRDKICTNIFDGIHPRQDGYEIIGEKLWEAAGGVRLGPSDVLDRTSQTDADFGYLRLVRRLSPRSFEARGGALVDTPAAALDDADAGAAARIRLGTGGQEFRLSGFPDWFDEIVTVRALVGARYRVAGPGQAVDELYRIEAALDGTFVRPPAYTPTNWNWYTPIVGGGGPNQPVANDYPNARLLVVPSPPSYRTVTATLSANPTLPAGAADYVWRAPSPEELATTTVRVVAAPLAGAAGDDDYRVELDHAWIDLYGWEKTRPSEVPGVALARGGGGALVVSFAPVAGATRYNVYQGRLASLAGGVYDHGSASPAEPLCEVPITSSPGGRLETSIAPGDLAAGSVYILVTAHVDDVESPAGSSSAPAEIDRSQSTCR